MEESGGVDEECWQVGDVVEFGEVAFLFWLLVVGIRKQFGVAGVAS